MPNSDKRETYNRRKALQAAFIDHQRANAMVVHALSDNKVYRLCDQPFLDAVVKHKPNDNYERYVSKQLSEPLEKLKRRYHEVYAERSTDVSSDEDLTSKTIDPQVIALALVSQQHDIYQTAMMRGCFFSADGTEQMMAAIASKSNVPLVKHQFFIGSHGLYCCIEKKVDKLSASNGDVFGLRNDGQLVRKKLMPSSISEPLVNQSDHPIYTSIAIYHIPASGKMRLVHGHEYCAPAIKLASHNPGKALTELTHIKPSHSRDIIRILSRTMSLRHQAPFKQLMPAIDCNEIGINSDQKTLPQLQSQLATSLCQNDQYAAQAYQVLRVLLNSIEPLINRKLMYSFVVRLAESLNTAKQLPAGNAAKIIDMMCCSQHNDRAKCMHILPQLKNLSRTIKQPLVSLLINQLPVKLSYKPTQDGSHADKHHGKDHSLHCWKNKRGTKTSLPGKTSKPVIGAQRRTPTPTGR